jgi:hypothetical protein
VTAEVEPLLSWLQRERRTNVIQEILWIQHYDLDGALEAGQPELAWRARGALLIFGVELYLRTCGVYPPATADQVDTARVVLRQLALVDRGLAEEAWQLLLRDAPADADGLAAEVADMTAFLEHRLGVRAARSRGEAIRIWADGLKLLREIGKGLGVGGSNGWYLSATGDHAEQLDWYDEVIRVASRDGGHRRAVA